MNVPRSHGLEEALLCSVHLRVCQAEAGVVPRKRVSHLALAQEPVAPAAAAPDAAADALDLVVVGGGALEGGAAASVGAGGLLMLPLVHGFSPRQLWFRFYSTYWFNADGCI